MNKRIIYFVIVCLATVATPPLHSQSPANKPPINQVSSNQRFARVSAVIDSSIAQGAFPSAVVGIVKDGKVIFHKAYGRLTYGATAAATDTSTMYDCASLTKVLCTTMCIMKLYDDGKISLDDNVATYIPKFAARGKQNVTIRNLLLHNSGFAPFRPVPKDTTMTEGFYNFVFNDTLKYKTGDSMVYSDLGFITLGWLVQAVSGKRLDIFFHDTFAVPMGLTRTMFNPPNALLPNVAPTEVDSFWTWQKPRALVHDPRAAFTDGVSGHAGLFSTAYDVINLMTMLTNGGTFNGKQYLKPATVAMFTKRASDRSTRALGWDTKADKGSSAGDLFSSTSYGHTGFTGTSVWVDPVRKLCGVLLTNRVYPTSENKKIQQVRPKFYDAVVQAENKE